MHSKYTSFNMNKKAAKRLLNGLPIGIMDAARLVLECTEELGEKAQEMGRIELLQLLRRILRTGVKTIKQEENTVSFEEAAWASVEARSGRREATKHDLRYFVRRMLRVEGIGKRPLRAMNRRECRHLLQRAFSSSLNSYRKGRAILHSIFAYGERQEWCSGNPVSNIEVPSIAEQPIEPLTMQEVRRLEKAAALPQHKDMLLPLQLMLYCGIRPTEITRMQTRDIQWQAKEVIVRPCTSKTGGGRIIPLRHIQRTETKGEYIAPANWKRRWKELRKDAGFEKWIPDVCRHTFASYHAAYFRNLPELQLEMGHRDSRLLLSRYTSPVPGKAASCFWRKAHKNRQMENSSHIMKE